MAIRYAVATGNWSSTSTWDGGVSLPTVGDDVYANGFNVQVDQDASFDKISTEECPTTLISGGRFDITTIPAGTRLLTGDLVAGTTTCLYHSYGSVSVTIVGNITGGSGAAAYGFYNGPTSGTAAQSPTIIGNITGGTGSGAYGYQTRTDRNYAPTITGNVTAGAGSLAYGLRCTSNSQTVNIIGNITSVNGTSGLFTTAGNWILTGIFTASNGVRGWAHYGSSSIYYVSGKGVCASDGTPPFDLYVNNKIFIQTGEDYILQMTVADASTKTLYTDFDQPSESDVREGTTYGSAVYTGTLIVPDPACVIKGVPTDDTVGTWAFDDDLILRLEKVSTVDSTGEQIAGYNI